MANIFPGNALYMKLPFADGGSCTYNRPFLVIDINQSKIKLLNCSSIRGKEHKLLIDSNHEIKVYNPPLRVPSFVKLDALYEIDYYEDLEMRLMDNGGVLDSKELSKIISKFNIYEHRNSVLHVSYTQSDVIQYNIR